MTCCMHNTQQQVSQTGPEVQLDNVVTKSASHDIADGVGSDDGSSVQSHSTFSDP